MKIRNNMATSIMGRPNWAIQFKQFGALPRYTYIVKPDYLLKGLFDVTVHPKNTIKSLEDNSIPFYTRSTIGKDRDIASIMKSGSEGAGATKLDKLKKWSMKPIAKKDRIVVSIGMQGAYLQALDEMKAGIKTGKLSPDFTKATGVTPDKLSSLKAEERIAAAYKFADWATEMTQTSGNPYLQSDFQRGNVLEKMFTLFSSEGSTAANLRRRAFFEARTKKSAKSWLRYTQAVVGTLLAEPIFEMVVDRARKEFMGQEQVPIGKDYIAHVAAGPFGVVPIARDTVRMAVNKVLLKQNYQNQGLTAFDNLSNAFVNFVMLALDPKTVKTEKGAIKFADSIIEISSLLTGVSASQVWRYGKGAANTLGKLVEVK
jgi:hypothetical protein